MDRPLHQWRSGAGEREGSNVEKAAGKKGKPRGREVKERELRRCFGLHAGAGKEVN
jgi:hypothetical protein